MIIFGFVTGLLFLILLSTWMVRRGIKKETEKRLLENKFVKNVILKSEINKGYKFSASITCTVLGTFFHEDDKYAITCPVIDNKLVGVPAVAKVTDESLVEYGNPVSSEMITKGLLIYRDFKKNNEKLFIDPKEFE